MVGAEITCKTEEVLSIMAVLQKVGETNTQGTFRSLFQIEWASRYRIQVLVFAEGKIPE